MPKKTTLEDNWTIWKRIDSWFWMKKLLLQCWWWERDRRHARRKYCRKGFHKLIVCRYGQKRHNDKRMRYVSYLKCRYCDWVFFANLSQKKRYNKMNPTTREDFLALLKKPSSPKSK